MDFLFAPARVELLTHYGSEVSWSLNLLQRLALDSTNHLTAICNVSDWDPPANVRLIRLGLPNANSEYGRLRFLVECGRIASKLAERGSFDVVHHMFPFGFHEGVDFFSTMFRPSDPPPVVIGPIQHPQQFVDEQVRTVLGANATWFPLGILNSVRDFPPVAELWRRLHTSSVAKASALVFDGAKTREMFVASYPDATRGRCQLAIPPAVETDLFSPGLVQGGDAQEAMSAGFLIRRKGFHVLIRSFTKVVEEAPRARLRIYGEGPAGPELRRLRDDLGLAEVVSFAGRVPREELAPCYRRAAVYVQPSLAETFPSAVREAMSCARPIVATETGLMDEYLIDGANALLVPVGDEKALGEAILRIITDSATARRLAESARVTALARMSWDVVLPQWLDLYNSLT